jgi:hypothetical protein
LWASISLFLFFSTIPPSETYLRLSGLVERFDVLKRLVIAEIDKIKDKAVERVAFNNQGLLLLES